MATRGASWASAGAMLVAAMSTACTATTDPRQAGFLGGLNNLATGAYEQRIDQRQATLRSLDAESAELAERAVVLDQRNRELLAEAAALDVELTALEAHLDEQQRQLALARSQAEIDRAWLAELERRRDMLEGELTQLQSLPQPPAAEIEAIERQSLELDAAISALLGDVRIE